MSSGYANMSQDSDSVTFAPIGEEEIAGDPFAVPNDSSMNHTGDLMEPLTGSGMGGGSVGGSVNDGNPMSMSLLERIQQQKNNLNGGQQQQEPSSSDLPYPDSAPTSTFGGGDGGVTNPSSNVDDNPFGYPMAEDTIYSHSSAAPESYNNTTTTNASSSINIPNYASPNLTPNPYDESTSASSSDIKDQMINALYTMGNVANSAARGAYRGTKYMYQKISNKSGSGNGSGAGGMDSMMNPQRRNEMDYQRESLLMDPHDLESSAATFGAGSSMNMGGAGSSAPNGLMGGMGGGSALAGGAQDGSYSILGYLKQFCVDVKDIFLAAPRKVQMLVIALAIFIIWLFISEEL